MKFDRRRHDADIKGENPMYRTGGNPLLPTSTGGTGKKKKIIAICGACLLMVGVLVFFLVSRKGGCGDGLIDEGGGTCSDILECTETHKCILDDNTGECPPDFNASPCRVRGICTELRGDYVCDCGPYWTGKNCDQDVNECIDGQGTDIESACKDQPHHRCVNQEGQDATCEFCGDGKTRSSADATVCVDLDECDTIGCQQKNHKCTNLLEWTAENGGYTCTDCGEEFVAQGGGSCVPDDWNRCLEDPCGKHGTSCTYENSQVTCTCEAGWGGETCDQVDKCYTSPLTSKQHRWTASSVSSLKHGGGFGSAAATLGDELNNDHIEDMAVGAMGADDGRGAVVFMFRTETVGALVEDTTVNYKKLRDDFDITLKKDDAFGAALAAVTTDDGDVVLMVGAPGRGFKTGAVFWLKLAKGSDSVTVSSAGELVLPDLVAGTFAGVGTAVANVGLVNDDNYPDIAVGAPGEGETGGTVRLLFLSKDGTSVKSWTKITATSGTMGGFEGPVNGGFGRSIASMGDEKRQWFGDDESTLAIAVGAGYYEFGGDDEEGVVFVISLTDEYTEGGEMKVKTARKIGRRDGGMEGPVSSTSFGRNLACVGDVDKDGVPDLAVGSPFHGAGTEWTGAVHIVTLSDVGVVKSSRMISATEGGLKPPNELTMGSQFGSSVTRINRGSTDIVELVVGATHEQAKVAYSVAFHASDTLNFLPKCALGERCVADDSDFVGRSGQTCQAVDWCTAMSLCKHESTACALDTDPSDGDDLFTCSCAGGWDGQTCEVAVI